MQVVDVYIKRCRWWVRIYFSVTCYHTDRILDDLDYLNCSDEIYNRAQRHLRRGNLNTGLTYSNARARKSVMVVGLSSTMGQFLNSFEHELRHLIDDIAGSLDIAIKGEDVAYLTGDMNALLFEDIHPFICCSENCKNINYGRIQRVLD